MQYRKLGKTGLEVSAIGLGSAQLGSSDTDYAIRMVHRALDLGINYFDTARGYWDSEIKLGLALKGRRDRAYVSTKTVAKTKEEAWQHLRESLERLQTDYVDNWHIHGLWESELDTRLGAGGVLGALIEARERGLAHHIGCTSHISRTLVKALQRFDFETILVPMNIVEREPLRELIPLCLEKGVGITIMKPVATGLLPATLALKWLLNQSIATAVPGATTLDELEENALVGHLADTALSSNEEREVARLESELEQVRCRVCRECEPCPVGIPIGSALGTDVMFDHHRTMGPETFKEFTWSKDALDRDTERRTQLIKGIDSCTDCGVCEERCPHDLPVVQMLREMIPPMREMLEIYQQIR
jgi:predicted aldo/keto reductase-like oxidoreductase